MYALILAGGKGERLRPLTDRLPKPMIPVAGRPILRRQVCWLRAAGVTDVIFLIGHRGDAVKDYFGDGGRYGIRAHYSEERSPLGRGGALRQGLGMLPAGYDAPALALNGDIITDTDPGVLLDDYAARRAANPGHLATILTVPMTSPYGIVDTDEAGLVRRFREKTPLPYAVNGGVYALHPAIAELLPERGDHEVSTFPALAEAGGMSAAPAAPGVFWRSVDSFKDLREAEEYIAAAGQPAAGGGTAL